MNVYCECIINTKVPNSTTHLTVVVGSFPFVENRAAREMEVRPLLLTFSTFFSSTKKFYPKCPRREELYATCSNRRRMRVFITTTIMLIMAFHLCVRSSPPPIRAQRVQPRANGMQRRFEFIRFGKRFVDEWNQPYSGMPIRSLVDPNSEKYLPGIRSLPSNAERLLPSY
uniref:Uncharacterized protein n=2 Tax=Parascaris univalens TaxID=6257 RepID=A0A914ZH91_PARUN